jgi:hypothetical protein
MNKDEDHKFLNKQCQDFKDGKITNEEFIINLAEFIFFRTSKSNSTEIKNNRRMGLNGRRFEKRDRRSRESRRKDEK